MIRIHTESSCAIPWLHAAKGLRPLFVCVLGFTETGLIPGISAAGATPADRQYTAIADAEFLYNGPATHPKHPLPPLHAGASPVFISRAVTTGQQIPVQLFNAGLPHPPPVPCIDLNGQPARCLTRGCAMDRSVVQQLFQAGLEWGDRLGRRHQQSYLILGECVVGGTTTAFAVLSALGWAVNGMVNSSHPTCNHQQKQDVVAKGLDHLRTIQALDDLPSDPLHLVAGVGDPVQVAIAGMLLAASRWCRVMLAGGTQMLAIYALASALADTHAIRWEPDQVIVGTTRWVADDPTGNTIGLAALLRCPLVSTQLSFAHSRYPALRAYEQGFVKEGVGAGGCAIAAELYQNWNQHTLLRAIEAIAEAHRHAGSLKESGP
ncbi:MAG: nicotinate mononucleotide-dependent phosphoribosyltransferase CobT [Cyanobacteria bacterium J06627_8]